MGIFSDNVRRYYEFGLVTVPCKDKRPVLGKEWQRFCETKPTEDIIGKWERAYGDINQLGLALGSATFLSAFDFDYEFGPRATINEAEFIKDRKNIERQIQAILPPTPCIKTGKKGWTRIFRSHGILENVQSDRNGLRLFDFLARNKQTIIPPSKYADDTDLTYRWLGSPIEDCLDDIPFITQDIVDEIKTVLGEKSEDQTRHGKLFRFAIRQTVLEKDVNEIAKRLVAYDRSTNATPYLSDKKHFPRDDAHTNAINWINRIIKWRDSRPGKDHQYMAEIKSSREMFFQFFDQRLGRHKQDLISDRLMVDVEIKTEYGTSNRRWRPAANMIPALRSDALTIGLKRELVEDNLAAYGRSLTPGLLLEMPEWDGQDRLAEICKITKPLNTSLETYTDVMKDVAAGIFRRTFDSMEQNLFTIIRGPQGAGKNYFIDKVFCQPFGHYSAEVNVGNDQAKNYDAVEGRLVCVIGEFDQTQKVQVSFIKELITNASFTARRAYERASERYDLRQTFFSASNFNNVLKDSSGNRRYVIWDMPKIDWAYTEHCDADQLRAQYFALFKTGHRMSEKSKAWIREFNAEETPDDPLELAVIEYVENNHRLGREHMDQWLKDTIVTPIINDASRVHGVPRIRLRQELNRRKLTKMSNGRKFANLYRLDELYKPFQLGRTEEGNISF